MPIARKTSKIPTRVYTYGCLSPGSEGMAAIRAQLELADRYYDDLATLERDRRSRWRAVRTEQVPGLQALYDKASALTQEIDGSYERLRCLRQRQRKRVDDPSIQAAIKVAKQRRHEVWYEQGRIEKKFDALCAPAKAELERRKKERSNGVVYAQALGQIRDECQQEMLDENWPESWKRTLRIDAEAKSKRKRLYERYIEKGLMPGTAELVHDAVAAAGKKGDPSDKRQHGVEGRIGFRYRDGGRTVSELASDCLMRMDPLPEDQWATTSGRASAHTTIHVNVGKTRISLPTNQHRPMPKDAIIKGGWILVTRHGPRTKLEFQFVLETTIGARRTARGTGTVALNFGWRQVDERDPKRLRVAYAVDDHGRSRELVLDISDIQYADALRRASDNLFNQTLRAVRLTCRWRSSDNDQWLEEQLKGSRAWRSHLRLARVAYEWVRRFMSDDDVQALWRRWVIHRMGDDDPRAIRGVHRKGAPLDPVPSHTWKAIRHEGAQTRRDLYPRLTVLGRWLRAQGIALELHMPVALEFWRRKNRHLYEWESGQRRTAIKARNEVYRKWAFGLSREYDQLVVDNSKLNQLSRYAAEESDEVTWRSAQNQRRSAAVSILRNAVRATFSADVKVVSSAGNTQKCSECGEKLKPVASHGIVECERCGLSDIDDNNCRNQLKKARIQAPKLSQGSERSQITVESREIKGTKRSHGCSQPAAE